jgi:hypothetical protein
MSGVAMETEFQLLNARLSEKADNLELAEEQMWSIFANYQGQVWDGSIDYPGSFSIRDVAKEFDQLQTARSAATDPAVLRCIDRDILKAMGRDDDYIEALLGSAPQSSDSESNVSDDADDTVNLARIQEMLMSGMSNSEILAAMPGTDVDDIVAAAALAAEQNT